MSLAHRTGRAAANGREVRREGTADFFVVPSDEKGGPKKRMGRFRVRLSPRGEFTAHPFRLLQCPGSLVGLSPHPAASALGSHSCVALSSATACELCL